MTPFVPPPEGYRSRPPYIVTLEWPDHFLTTIVRNPYAVIADAWETRWPMFGPDSPRARFAVDARGVFVLGLQVVDHTMPVLVMSEDVREAMEVCWPQGPEDFFEFEMTGRLHLAWREEVGLAAEHTAAQPH